jgi:predicted ABC-type ATPase
LNVDSVAFQAARIMLEKLDYFIKEKKSFAFETTLSGLIYLKFMRVAKIAGCEITLFFVWLHSFELAKSRVTSRVATRQTTGIFTIIRHRNMSLLQNVLRVKGK